MANNEFLLLRHAKTKISNKIPSSKWTLSKEGFKEAEELTLVKEFKDLDIIISSCEKKAYLTVKPLALRNSKSVTQICDFNELFRDSGVFLSSVEEYNLTVKRCMHESDKSFNNWEKGLEGQNIFLTVY